MPETTSSSAAFIDAIKAGEFERVKAMVSADPTLIDARSRTGDSAILTAVYHRQKEIVNLLVARGASLSMFEACAAGEARARRAAAARERERRGRRARRQRLQQRRLDAAAPRRVLRPRQDRRAADRARRRRARASRGANGNTPLHAALAGNHKFVAGAADRPRRRRQRRRRAGLAAAAPRRRQQQHGRDEAADRAGRRRPRRRTARRRPRCRWRRRRTTAKRRRSSGAMAPRKSEKSEVRSTKRRRSYFRLLRLISVSIVTDSIVIGLSGRSPGLLVARLADLVDDVHALGDLAEDAVLVVEPRRRAPA